MGGFLVLTGKAAQVLCAPSETEASGAAVDAGRHPRETRLYGGAQGAARLLARQDLLELLLRPHGEDVLTDGDVNWAGRCERLERHLHEARADAGVWHGHEKPAFVGSTNEATCCQGLGQSVGRERVNEIGTRAPAPESAPRTPLAPSRSRQQPLHRTRRTSPWC